MRRFGKSHLIGTEGFAKYLGIKRLTKSAKDYSDFPFGLQELTFLQKKDANVSVRDIENLLLSGDLDISKLAQSDISGGTNSYTITRRQAAYQRVQNANASRPILVHGDIGNGKTVFALQVAYLFSQKGSRVFRLLNEPEDIGGILSFFQTISDPTLLVIDDIMRFNSLPSSIMNSANPHITILATVRSAYVETSIESVKAKLGSQVYFEVDLNSPSREETQKIVSYCKVNTLFGKYAELSDDEINNFIDRECAGQIRDVILSLYETGSLHQRIELLLLSINALPGAAKDLVLLSSLFKYAGFHGISNFSELSELSGYRGSYEDLRKSLKENDLSSLLRMDTGDLMIRSPALAEFILRRVFSIEVILNTVKKCLFVMDKYYVDDQDFERMAKGLLKYSLYGKIIGKVQNNTLISRFYDDCRVLKFASNDPLFLVQRSICSMNFGDFDPSFRFVESAYALAKKKINFDVYQIDNHHARLLLTKSREQGVSENGEREQKAHALLQSVLSRKSDDLYHPLSVMRIYIDIVDRWSSGLSKDQKIKIKKIVDQSIISISSFRHLDRYRNLPNLKSRLNAASSQLK
jgi:hypothetical protein